MTVTRYTKITAAFTATLLALGLSACGAKAEPEKPAMEESQSAAPEASQSSEAKETKEEEKAPTKLETFTAYVPGLTMAFGAPMAGFGKNGHLDKYADKVEVKDWDSVDQLKSALINNEVQVAATPAYAAANLYNKGVDIKFVGSVVWGMIYGIAQEGAPVDDWNALKGKKVGVALPGNMPDLVFSYILKEKGINKEKDFTFVPVQEPRQLVGMLAKGEVDYAILPEQAATLAMMKAKKQGKNLVRALNLQTAWGEVTGGKARFPMAGLVVPGKLYEEHPEIAQAIRDSVGESIEKLNAGDEQALKLVADKYQLPPPVVKDVLPRLQLDMVSADDSREAYEDFLKRLGEINPQIYGGKLPDDAFYTK